ncbi:MAG: hypothetical protein ACRDDJ_08345, partial [[Mycobacterium] stephanolepidis]
IRNYIDPLQQAVSCLGCAKIQLSQTPKKYGEFGAWVLNGGDGMALRGFGKFYATQRFELVPTTADLHDAPEKEPFRVSTREYIYRLEITDKSHVIEWHWHPVGNSDERRPHIHPAINRDAHLPGPRMVLEDVIEGCIALGATPACEDWKERLAATGGVHKLYRTWVHEPGDLKKPAVKED